MFEAAGLKIIVVTLDVDNAEEGVEADIVFLDAKGTLYRLHFTRGEDKPTHTILKIQVSDPEKLLKSCQQFHVSKQTISIGKRTFNIKTGEAVYTIGSRAIAHAMAGSTNLMLVEASDKGR